MSNVKNFNILKASYLEVKKRKDILNINKKPPHFLHINDALFLYKHLMVSCTAQKPSMPPH